MKKPARKTCRNLFRPAEFIVLALAAACLCSCGGKAGRNGHAFRVKAANGVPQLRIDGKPARARIFWGGPGAGGSARLGAEWTEVAFEFTAADDDAGAALHLRFGEDPGEVWFDDIRIEDLTAGVTVMRSDFEDAPEGLWRQWQMWCAGRDKQPAFQGQVAPGAGRNGSAALHVTLGADPKLKGLHLYRSNLKLAKDHRCKATLWARASAPRKLVPTVHHQGGDFQKHGGMPGPYPSQVRIAAAHGVDLVSFPIPTLWKEPAEDPGTRGIDTACRMTLDANPKALLLPRIGMYPPKWWLEAHPDAVMQYEGGKPGDTASVSSTEYRRDADAALRRTIRWCEEHFGPHMAGYHPCGQNTGEWFYYDSWQHPLNGLEPATLHAWRRWLAEKYPSDDALRAAWGDSSASLASAAVPSPAERRSAPNGQLRDPAREMRLLDFAQFQQEEMADTVVALARAVREAAGPDRLSVFFYGYVFEFGTLPNAPSVSGHYALRSTLNSPDIDILCAPISYYDRQAGGGAPCMTAGESVMLAGKLWLNEDDTRTYLAKDSRAPGWQAGADSQAESVELMRRNLAQETCRNFATWWMDLGSSGWFDDPVLWQEMVRFHDVEERLLKAPVPFHPEIAAVIDERAMLLPVGSGPVPWTTRPLIYTVRENFHRIGAPFGQYLLDDIAAARVRAKMHVFLNAWRLDARQRAALKAAVRGAANVWCWAPGYWDGEKSSLETVADLTGFRVKPMPPGTTVHVTATPAGAQAGLPATFGDPKPVAPLLAPEPASGDEVLATFANGAPAVVFRKSSDGISVFSAITSLPTPLLRHVARHAGVHLYCETDANVFANGPLLAVHAANDDPLTLVPGKHANLRNLVTGERLRSDRIKLNLRKGQTAVFVAEP